jgi:hypothetical protein
MCFYDSRILWNRRLSFIDIQCNNTQLRFDTDCLVFATFTMSDILAVRIWIISLESTCVDLTTMLLLFLLLDPPSHGQDGGT